MAEIPVDNSERILGILDSYLENENRIALFGRAAPVVRKILRQHVVLGYTC
jgi:hypothetical protein